MKFVGLGYQDEARWEAMSEGERERLIKEVLPYDDALRQSGFFTEVGEALEPSKGAKTLRMKGGKVVVTDGPYAETKEQLGGFGVIEARDMDHAVEVMVKHPAMAVNPHEIRPMDEEMTERATAGVVSTGAPSEGVKFVCLGYGDESKWNALSKSEVEALIAECFSYDVEIRKYGQVLGGVALQSAGTAKTVRSREGKVIVTDGPYAETKELLGGVAINRFKNIDEAVKAWSKHPCLRVGDVLEIRQVSEFYARVAARESATK